MSNLKAARSRGEIPAGTDVVGAARFLTALDIGLVTYGVTAPRSADRGPALDLLDAFLDRLPASPPGERGSRRGG